MVKQVKRHASAWMAASALAAVVIASMSFVRAQRDAPEDRGERWVATWATAQQLMVRTFDGRPGAPAPPGATTTQAVQGAAGTTAIPPAPAAPPPTQGPRVGPGPSNMPATFEDQTIRMTLRASLGGQQVRIALSNMLGAQAVEIGAAHIAVHKGSGVIVPQTDRALTFSGKPSLLLASGVLAISDPVSLTVAPMADLAVSLYLPRQTGQPTKHEVGVHTAYIAKGDATASERLDVIATTTAYAWLSGVDVLAPAHAYTIVTLGDSITDGFATTTDADRAWPTLLAKRLRENPRTRHVGVVNQGISANQVLRNGAGLSMVARVDRDVLGRPGVKWVVLLGGINDINFRARTREIESFTADDLIAGYRQIIDRCHAHGIKIMGATLTPQEGLPVATARGEEIRQAVNRWMRTSRQFDAVVDFDAAVRDPEHPARLEPEFDPGDFLHPNDAGNAAMAAAFDLRLFADQPPPSAERRDAAPPRSPGPRRMSTPVTALVSPEVHEDRRVTLRFRAPEATTVQLVGEITQGRGPQPMSKDADGLWTTTIGPLPPEIWSYNFRVHGVDVTDPSNPAIKPTPPGQAMSSFVEVPGDAPAFYDARPVPHGEVRMVLYESKAMGVTRWLWIYTPPGYDRSPTRYPVLYLLHGNGEAQNGWVMNGRANIILDNAIAERAAQPMVVVMPQGHALQGAGVGPLQRIAGETSMFSPRFPQDLLDEIIPLVERSYRVKSGAQSRAIAGLSMGGGQALSIGLTHPATFGYVLGFSAAVGGQFAKVDELFTSMPSGSKAQAWRLLWISCGRQDFLYENNKQFADALTQRGLNVTYRETEGAHVWSVWRRNLRDVLPLLFQ
jgi:enterochelin esterase-like enzyme/lysophospholipase L1-like esterase